jgi:cell division septation protein DedD
MLALCGLFALTACDEPFQPFGNGGTRNATDDGPTPIGATRLVERDVEAPEIFEVTEEGLWDGRPSLGGVWVAHPSADDPERVIIRNEENGRFVIGALFRREHDNPGPMLMISSDAAAALNILAGDPTQVQVTALRREEVTASEEAPAPEAGDDTGTTPAEITASPLSDPIAAADAAITEAEIAEGIRSAAANRAPAQPPAAAPSAPPASSLDRPYVQIGIFSVQQNANDTAQGLRTAGLMPTVYDQSTNGRRFWRVVVGPAQTAAQRNDILRTVRGLGFEDAYPVTR